MKEKSTLSGRYGDTVRNKLIHFFPDIIIMAQQQVPAMFISHEHCIRDSSRHFLSARIGGQWIILCMEYQHRDSDRFKGDNVDLRVGGICIEQDTSGPGNRGKEGLAERSIPFPLFLRHGLPEIIRYAGNRHHR